MKQQIKKWILLESSNQKLHESLNEYTLLFIRVAVSLSMLLEHGWDKMMNFSKIAPNFVDPFGFLGSTLSLTLVVGSQLFGALFLILGLFTRWASFSLLFTMSVAAFIVHFNDPFDDKELPIMYALLFLYYSVAGGGKYSLDFFLKKNL